MVVVGAENTGHVVMLKAHSRKRQAEGSNGSAEAALDTQQAEGQKPVAEGREQQGQDVELTLEQRVNALQLHQTPGAVLSWAVLANFVLCRIVAALYVCHPDHLSSSVFRLCCNRLIIASANCICVSVDMSVHISLLCSGVPKAVDPASPSDKAVSVTVLLTQALRADDRQLLEKCFAISNDRVVKSTVQQLAPQDVARLLQVAVQRLQSSPKRGRQIATWLRAMLLHHTAYLMSAPGTFSLRP